jgi:tetratricopeptide (TPR) repeat protein
LEASSDADDAPEETSRGRARRHIRRGDEYLARGELAAAEASYSSALSIDSRRHEAIAGLGKVAFQRNEYLRAEELARNALGRSPTTVRYRLDLGAALYRQGKVRQAETLFRQILHEQPNNRAAKRYLEAATRGGR